MITILGSSCTASCPAALAAVPAQLAASGISQGQVDPVRSRMPLVDHQDIRFRKLADTSTLSQTRVSSAVQDDLGFMWFGTQYGLNRYDGYKFKVFTHEPGNPNSLSGVFIRSLFKDRSGVLWVGCDQSYDRFNPATETFTHFHLNTEDPNEPSTPVIQTSEDRNGMLWLATAKGLFKLDPASGKSVRYAHDPNIPSSLSSSYVNYTGEDRQGQFWVADGGGLEAFDRDSGRVTLRVPFAQEISFSFHEDIFGTFWITRTSPDCALATLDRKTKKATCYTLYEANRSVKNLAGIYSMLESRDGTMWIASAGEGLLKFDRENKQLIRYRNHPDDNESIGSNSVLALYEDKEGDIWSCLHQIEPNVFSERPSAFETFTHQRGSLAGSLVTAIHEDRDGILWIGSTGALNRIDRQSGKNTVPLGSGVDGEILSIVEDTAGLMLVGTYRDGLQRLDPKTGLLTSYQHDRSKSIHQDKMPIMRLFRDHRGTLWAAMWGGLGRFDPVTREFKTLKPDPKNEVDYSDIKEDARGGLWLGGESGLQYYEPGINRFTIYKHDSDNPQTVSDNRVTSVFIARSGEMWIGTQNGLDKFDPSSGRFRVFYTSDGLPGNVVSCLLEDERGTLWMGTNNGLASLDPKTLKFKNYSAADGLPGPDLTGWSSCSQSRRGEMFFGGFSGATAFYPDKLQDVSYAPTTVLTDFRLSGVSVPIGRKSPLRKSITYTDELTLSHSQNIFSLEFSALSYFNTLTNRFRYKLDGLDSEWHEVGSDQRIASYTTLPGGNYTLRVQSATSRGAWSEPGVVLHIRIFPPWWTTWWFSVSYIAIFLLLIWLAYQYRLRQIAHQFSLRLEERLYERTRLARDLHDTLLQTIEASKLIADVALDKPSDADRQRATLQRLSSWLERATQEGRAVLHSLRSSSIQQDDLLESLRLATVDCTKQANLEITFSFIGTPEELHPLCREEIYHIGSEAIRNACLHAKASLVQVQVRYAEDFVLTVSDNGVGIPEAVLERGRQGHYGIKGMKERAERIGGKLLISTSTNNGTTVTLRVPSSAYRKK